jgi:hypothetical protein
MILGKKRKIKKRGSRVFPKTKCPSFVEEFFSLVTCPPNTLEIFLN